MASTIKVDNVQNQPGTNIVNKCGTTVTVGAASDGIRSAGNNLQASDGGNLISQSGTDITLGASGDTVALASGASQTGFGRTGTVDWITTPKVTGDSPVTGVTGKGYFLDTTAGTITLNLPAGSAGDIVSMADYAGTWQTNNVTLAANGTEKIGGIAEDVTLSTEGQSVTLVYTDSTQGWINTMDSTSNVRGVPPYIGATGGNAIVTCGNFKTHIFTGPGAFCVSRVAVCAADSVVDYLVVAGGGGGAGANGPGCGGRGGGGAGGGRTFQSTPSTNPLTAPAGITVSVSPYTITVGGGGTAGPPSASGGNGNTSTFDSITSTGGGFGATHPASGGPGGSGGGTYAGDSAGVGNTPPVSPPQGNSAVPAAVSGGTGGGGWGAAPPGSSPTNAGTAGGAGSYLYDVFVGPTAPTYGEAGPVGSTRYFAGGGGGGGYNAAGGAGGVGGGGCGVNSYGPGGCGSPAIPGTINTGGGGGSVGAAGPGGTFGGAGGSGVVMIRYRYQ